MPARQLLSIVVPCFNEGEGLDDFFARLLPALRALPGLDHEIICVDDGSSDQTLQVLRRHAAEHSAITVLELSRNFGKEAALSAGLDAARGDAVVPIDADLQHPPEVIADLVAAWRAGSDMVLAVRRAHQHAATWDRSLAHAFYWLHNRWSDVKVPRDAGDFRLLDRSVVEALRRLPERRRFMKGLFAWVGFRQSVVEFDVADRQHGHSSFNARARWSLAVEGITSFSTVPLRVWSLLGIGLAALALSYGSWILIKTLLFGIEVPGYASMLTAVLFLGGVQLLSIGILGEYLGRVYSEAKQRPLYIVRRQYGQGHD